MKKTLVAAAVSGLLASTAFAQNVTLAGLVDVFAGSIQYSGDKRTAKVDSNGKVLVAYANTKFTRSNTSATSKRATFSVGYDYILSKRTDLYVVGMNDKITGFDRGNSFAVGVRHRF